MCIKFNFREEPIDMDELGLYEDDAVLYQMLTRMDAAVYRKNAETLTEYLLTMQIHQEKSQYAHLMVQLSPFLYELFLAYIKTNITIPVLDYREKIRGKRILRREILLQKPLGRELVSFLDEKFRSTYYDSELSFILLYQIFNFAG